MANHDELRDRLDGDDRLGRFLRETREQLCTPPPDDIARHHQLLLAEAAREAAHVAPTTTARPERGASWGQRLRRVAGLTSVKLAFTGAAALAATGGLAATDSLPEPAQRVVSQVADRVGIDLPNPDDVPTGPTADGVPDGVEPGGAPDQVPPVDTPAPDDATQTGGEHAEDDTPPADGDLPDESDGGTDEADEATPDDTPATDAPPDDTPATDAPPEGTAPDGTPPTDGEVPPEQADTGTGEAGERTSQDAPPTDTPSERPGEGP